MDIIYSQRSKDRLEDLEEEKQQRIVSKLEEAKDFPDHFLELLKGTHYYKLRVGKLRVIIDWDKSKDELFVSTLGHRKNIYESIDE